MSVVCGGLQVNKFQQVSRDDHQMSLARAGARVGTGEGDLCLV